MMVVLNAPNPETTIVCPDGGCSGTEVPVGTTVAMILLGTPPPG